MPTAKAKTVTKTTTETPITRLEPNAFQYEILELVSKQRTNLKKVELLKEYRNPALTSLLIWNFDESVISILPPGPVPYADPNEQSSVGGNLSELINSKAKNTNLNNGAYAGTEELMNKQRTSLRKEYENFYIFLKGGSNTLSQIRKETIFINMLQGLHPLEAELLCLVKDKKLTDKYKVSLDNIKEAYPDIRWGGRS